MPIRVLNIVTQMTRDGLENRLMDIYRHLDRAQVQFDFYTFRTEEGPFDPEIRQLGGQVYYNPPLSVTRMYQSRADFIRFLLAHPEYRIVHAHMNQWCGLILSAAQQAGVPVRIAHSRNAFRPIELQNLAKNIIKLPVNRFATHRFAVSRKAAVWLYGKKAVDKGLVQVWPNAIAHATFRCDSATRAEVRQELNLGDSLVIMHVGNSRLQKNHPFLLAIFAALKQREPSARLVLVGRGDWSEVGRIAEQLGVAASVTCTGSRADVNRVLQAADVFVFPSLYEGLPGAVLEAQAAGLPCIIADTITPEVCITPLAEQLPLSWSAEQWADKVYARRDQAREDTAAYFVRRGFDIDSLVQKLTDFYLHSGEVI